jgi:hypothetical protein
MDKKADKSKRKTRKLKLEELKTEYVENKCDVNMYSDKCNTIALKKEELEVESTPELDTALYPILTDPLFSEKIANKKEFNDTKYDGEIFENVKKHANDLITENFKVLRPHQSFVKNFLSFQTPFNSLLLYHGLGSGKTCSAIGVCEESRDYLKQTGLTKKNIIVASPNVLDNFKKQLFDETKLKKVSGLWTISSCIGNKLIDEINPTNATGITEDQIILQVKNLIRTYYVFMGYIEFANHIKEIVGDASNKQTIRKRLQAEFNDRLLVIDEMHNIRISDEDTKNKMVAEQVLLLISNAERMRLLLLTATPMYNSCTEIVWLINLMNINDRRPIIKIRDVFKDGELTEEGRGLLVRKLRGYISYVRGENPYTFPFRIFPKDYLENPYVSVVSVQMNGRKIMENTTLDLYASPIGEEQLHGYAAIMDSLKQMRITIETEAGDRIMPHFSKLETMNYTILQVPLQALNIIYPTKDGWKKNIDLMEFYEPESSSTPSSSSSSSSATTPSSSSATTPSSSSSSSSTRMKEITDTDEEETSSLSSSSGGFSGVGGAITENITGKNGLLNVVSVSDGKYTYLKKRSGFFSQENIGKYSSKIKRICDHIMVATGIVLVYSQYIDGGLIPMALSLEELGFRHFNGPLFDPPISAKKRGTYAMIMGNTNNAKEIVNQLTDLKNKDGDVIKVILISKTGSEGIDLKYIRQIHIMEPWYNINRIEQIIGRGVRDGSHKNLPFEQRNVEIYMHSTIIPSAPELELVDEYIYRIAEKKAKKIGQITKLMKETAVDCILNEEQLNFTEDNFPKKIKLILSSGATIEDFQVGDKDGTSQCDYDTCIEPVIHEMDVQFETYNIKFATEVAPYITDVVKSLMTERHFYKSETLILEISRMGRFSIEQILVALSKIIDENVPIYDKYKRQGTLINVGDYYLFQPNEITNKHITAFERMVPLRKKPEIIGIKMDEVDDQSAAVQGETDGMDAIQRIKETYDLIIEYAKEKTARGEKEWNKICGSALHLLVKMELIPTEKVVVLLVEHLIDYTNYTEIVDILNYFTHKDGAISDATFEGKIYTYLTTNKVNTLRDIPFISLYDKKTQKIAKLNVDINNWEIVSAADAYTIFECNEVLKKNYESIKLNPLIGFIDYDEDGFVFKTKETKNTRNSGAKCANAGKAKTYKQMNTLIGGNAVFTPANTKDISQSILCIMQEFLTRHYDKTRTGKWFLTREEERILSV